MAADKDFFTSDNLCPSGRGRSGLPRPSPRPAIASSAGLGLSALGENSFERTNEALEEAERVLAVVSPANSCSTSSSSPYGWSGRARL